jgi:hypothetical protein
MSDFQQRTKPLLARQVKFENIELTKVDLPNISAVNIRYKHDATGPPGKFLIQTPKMKVLFGVSNNKKFAGDDKKKIRHSVELQRVDHFHTFIESLEDFFIEEAIKNKWIKNKGKKNVELTVNTVRNGMFNSCLKEFTSEKEDGTTGETLEFLKVGIHWRYERRKNEEDFDEEEGKPTYATFYDTANVGNPDVSKPNEISVDNITKGCEIVAIIEFKCIYIINNSLSPVLHLEQAQVYPAANRRLLKGFAIRKDSEDSEDSDHGGLEDDAAVDRPGKSSKDDDSEDNESEVSDDNKPDVEKDDDSDSANGEEAAEGGDSESN